MSKKFHEISIDFLVCHDFKACFRKPSLAHIFKKKHRSSFATNAQALRAALNFSIKASFRSSRRFRSINFASAGAERGERRPKHLPRSGGLPGSLTGFVAFYVKNHHKAAGWLLWQAPSLGCCFFVFKCFLNISEMCLKWVVMEVQMIKIRSILSSTCSFALERWSAFLHFFFRVTMIVYKHLPSGDTFKSSSTASTLKHWSLLQQLQKRLWKKLHVAIGNSWNKHRNHESMESMEPNPLFPRGLRTRRESDMREPLDLVRVF